MPRFVTMRANGAVIDFAPFGTLNNFRHLKRSISGIPLILWVSVSFKLKRLRIRHVLPLKTRHQHFKRVYHFSIVYLPLNEIVLHQHWEALSDPRDLPSLRIRRLYTSLINEEEESVAKSFKRSGSGGSIRSGKGELNSF
jgi:hypothetical protein